MITLAPHLRIQLIRWPHAPMDLQLRRPAQGSLSTPYLPWASLTNQKATHTACKAKVIDLQKSITGCAENKTSQIKTYLNITLTCPN